MKTVSVDLANCRTETDVHARLANALAAPAWHGYSQDAWWDSICSDEINGVRSPYHLMFFNTDLLQPESRHYLEQIVSLFADARRVHGLEVAATIER